MARQLTELELQLRQNDTVDVPARQIALVAVDDMMRAATRAGALLKAAQEANVAAAVNPASAAAANAASLARSAYEQRTSAEVAKYRAAYALMAEQHGQESATAAENARMAESAMAQRPFISSAKYHGKVRDLMLQASEAAAKALKMVPPLPFDVAPMTPIGPESNVAQGKPTELLASPTFNWRPKKYSELMGEFYPLNYKLAAGALSGMHGVSVGSQFGTADATIGQATGSTWWASLQKALGYGVKAAGEAAASEGQKKAGSDPAGGQALQAGSSILNVLSAMLGVGVDDGMRDGAAAVQVQQGPDWGTIALVGGGVAVGGYVLWKMLH